MHEVDIQTSYLYAHQSSWPHTSGGPAWRPCTVHGSPSPFVLFASSPAVALAHESGGPTSRTCKTNGTTHGSSNNNPPAHHRVVPRRDDQLSELAQVEELGRRSRRAAGCTSCCGRLARWSRRARRAVTRSLGQTRGRARASLPSARLQLIISPWHGRQGRSAGRSPRHPSGRIPYFPIVRVMHVSDGRVLALGDLPSWGSPAPPPPQHCSAGLVSFRAFAARQTRPMSCMHAPGASGQPCMSVVAKGLNWPM